MTDTESKLDQLTSKACETSLTVQDLLEKNDPSAIEAYNAFYQVAIEALDLQEAQMSDIKHANENFMEEVSNKLVKLQNLTEDLGQFEEEVKRSKGDNEKFKSQIEVQKEINEKLVQKLNKRKKIIPQIKQIAKSIVDLRSKEPAENQSEELEKAKQAELQNSIDQIKKQMNETLIRSKSLIKKNQMKAAELEAKIKKSNSSNSLNMGKDKSKKQAGPSMIIHRTQDSQADEVRLLHASMEEALRTNSMVKGQLLNLNQDLNALREENVALKSLMRNVMKKDK